MPLTPVKLKINARPLPAPVTAFLAEADGRIERFASRQVHAFIPSDYVLVYDALREVAALAVAPGNALCEWGCGMGVVATMGVMLGYEACGIEINHELVDEARALAEDFDQSVEFICGNMIPTGGDRYADSASSEMSWLSMGGHDAYEQLGLDVDDFDAVFAYPWPGEEDVIDNLFEHYAAVGALLITYHGIDGIRIQRKV